MAKIIKNKMQNGMITYQFDCAFCLFFY